MTRDKFVELIPEEWKGRNEPIPIRLAHGRTPAHEVRLNISCHGSHLGDITMPRYLPDFGGATIGIKGSRIELRDTDDERVPKVVVYCREQGCGPVQANIDKLRAVLWSLREAYIDGRTPPVETLTSLDSLRDRLAHVGGAG